MTPVLTIMITLLIIVSIFAALYASYTGLSVYVSSPKLTVGQRRFLTASLASAIVYLPLIALWTIGQGWNFMTVYESTGWLVYHLMVLFTVNGYHNRLRKQLGFPDFKHFWTKWMHDERGTKPGAFYRTFIRCHH